MDAHRSTARRHARWQRHGRIERSAAAGAAPTPAASGPREVLGSRYDERGTISGPYDYHYRIDAGYATERTVIRP